MTEQEIQEIVTRSPSLKVVIDLVAIPQSPEEITEEFGSTDSELMERCMELVNYEGVGITRGTLYAKARREGATDKFALMVSMQRAPGGLTDDVFFAGVPTLADQIGSQVRTKRLVEIARRHGYNPSPYDMYQSGLARFEGDPEAFVSKAQGRGYIKRLCEQRGWACEGLVNVKAREPEDDPLADRNCIPMAPSLIKQNAAKLIKQDPSLAHKPQQEIRQAVLDRFGPQKV